MHGLNLNPLLPVRTNASEQSEMCTQLLFGDIFDILETAEKWIRIRNCSDRYEGWCDRKMICLLSGNDIVHFLHHKPILLKTPVTICAKNSETIFLPAGSRFFADETGKKFTFREEKFILPQKMQNTQACTTEEMRQSVERTAMQFLNAPYLWGGKSIFGIDCSGLSQLCYDICGISLPRNASQQAKCGENIDLNNTKCGDLAFFENEKKHITHVGLLLGNGKIIHASGRVKIEDIDEKGIYSAEQKKYTHTLAFIRQIIH